MREQGCWNHDTWVEFVESVELYEPTALQHISSCASCRSRLSRFREIGGLVRSIELLDLPKTVTVDDVYSRLSSTPSSFLESALSNLPMIELPEGARLRALHAARRVRERSELRVQPTLIRSVRSRAASLATSRLSRYAAALMIGVGLVWSICFREVSSDPLESVAPEKARMTLSDYGTEILEFNLDVSESRPTSPASRGRFVLFAPERGGT